MSYEILLKTFSESYLLTFLALHTFAHLFYTRVIKRPLKLEEGVSYSLDFVHSNSEGNFITDSAFFVMLLCVLILPFSALSSTHYWLFLLLTIVLIITLFISNITFVTRNNRANEGLVAYIAIFTFSIPTLAISLILYYFDI